MKRIVLDGGCFWCIEAVFSKVKGIISAVSSYGGGVRENPTYEMICQVVIAPKIQKFMTKFQDRLKV
jgi:peptide methionine sulfoxide reductase MsrA